MEAKEGAGSSLDTLISSFNVRISQLQQLVIARNMYPASSVADLSAIDASLKGMELQVLKIKQRLHEETEAIPKAKKLIEASLRQQKTLQRMSTCAPLHLPKRCATINLDANRSMPSELHSQATESIKIEDPAPKEKKSRASAPLWYITAEELNSLSSYMKGRLTLEKVNATIHDMAAYAEANAQLVTAPRKKLSESLLDKVLELREISMAEAVKGKHFFLESDIRGPSLKLDNTGKAILTVLRHLGRITESRVGHHRVIILLRPC